MEINKVQWRMIAKGAKLPCDSFLMKKDGTMTSMVTGAGVTVGQDAYYLPVEELRSFPKEESEDERIRKELIAEVKEKIDCIPVPDCRDKEDEKALKQLNKWLAWLEKQAEKKPDVIIPKFRVGDEIKTSNEGSLTITKIDENGYWSEDLFICDFDEECLWDLVEQKPTEEYNITGIGSKHAQGKLGEMIKRKLEMEKQNEQKTAELPKGEDYGIDGLYAAIDILQKTLGEVDGYQSDDGILEHKCAIEAVNRLYKQESAWSKEDEMMMMFCCDYLDDNQKSWLLSLKERCTWKPSDEQMKALDDVISSMDIKYDVLSELWKDLKKLKG